VRTFLNASVETLTAFFFAASIGIGAGVAATSFTHRLGQGVWVAGIAFLVAMASFGYVIWRTYRPLDTASGHRPRALEAHSSR
jgi:membrane protein implicated in regulation of membrane protease activity